MTAPTITGVTTDDTTTPLLIEPWRTTQEPQTIVHDVQGADSPWVTLGRARTRTGTLAALYEDEASAEVARALLSGAELFAITYPERPSLEITFAVTGPLEVELHRNRRYWSVRWQYREVTP